MPKRLAGWIVAVLAILGIPGAFFAVFAIAFVPPSIASGLPFRLPGAAILGIASLLSVGPPLLGLLLLRKGRSRASVLPLGWSALFGLAVVALLAHQIWVEIALRTSCDPGTAIDTKEKAIAFIMERGITTPGRTAECREKCRFSYGWGLWTVDVGDLAPDMWPEVTFDRCGHFRSPL